MARSNSAPNIVILKPNDENSRPDNGRLSYDFGQKHHRQSIRKKLRNMLLHSPVSPIIQRRRASNSSVLGFDSSSRGSSPSSVDIKVNGYTVELKWPEHLWNHEKMFETEVVRANKC